MKYVGIIACVLVALVSLFPPRICIGRNNERVNLGRTFLLARSHNRQNRDTQEDGSTVVTTTHAEIYAGLLLGEISLIVSVACIAAFIIERLQKELAAQDTSQNSG
jgi:hypothetical protein